MAFTDFYRQARWIKLRNALLHDRVNAEGLLLCENCGKPIIKDYDAILHHKVELTPQNVNDDEIAYNPDNLAFVHARCHNEIHNRFGGRIKTWQRKVYYVWGAPCSGKSTFVQENMQVGDLVLDIDRIWQALSGQPAYIKPNELKAVVFNTRNAVLDNIKTRAGNWQQAFVIEGGALIGDRMRRIETLGAESIFIDATIEECFARLHEAPNGRDIPAWEEYIKGWFSTYQPNKAE